MPPLLVVVLVLGGPCLFPLLLSESERARRLAGRFLGPLVALGWTGVVLLVTGAFVLDAPASDIALAAGAPLSGLAVWSRGDGGDDGGGDDEPPDDGPGPVDWEAFSRELELWSARQRRAGRGPRPRQPT